MKSILLKEYGSILTGREFGKQVAKELMMNSSAPVMLDFQGVVSLGSSFGDEVVPPLALRQEKNISIINANHSIKTILRDVAADASINIKFQDG